MHIAKVMRCNTLRPLFIHQQKDYKNRRTLFIPFTFYDAPRTLAPLKRLRFYTFQKHLPSIIDFREFSNVATPSIYVGAKVVLTKKITKDIVRLFAEASGDWNPIHFSSNDQSTARVESGENGEKDDKIPIVHGALLNGLVSAVIGTQLPGPGTVVISQTYNFPAALKVDSQVNVEVEVINCKRREVNVQYKVVSTEDDIVVMNGTARLMVPKGRISKNSLLASMKGSSGLASLNSGCCRPHAAHEMSV